MCADRVWKPWTGEPMRDAARIAHEFAPNTASDAKRGELGPHPCLTCEQTDSVEHCPRCGAATYAEVINGENYAICAACTWGED